jgi:hypothetical protein
MSLPAPRLHRGQASVELVALVPAIVVIALLGWWVALAAHEWILAGSAARAAVRAQEVGAPAESAARAILGPTRRAGAHVDLRTTRSGAPRAVVSLPIPGILPGIPGHVVRGRAALGAGPGAP